MRAVLLATLMLVGAVACAGGRAAPAPSEVPMTTTVWERNDATRQIALTLTEGAAARAEVAVFTTMGGEQPPFAVDLRREGDGWVGEDAGCRLALRREAEGLVVESGPGCPRERKISGTYRRRG